MDNETKDNERWNQFQSDINQNIEAIRLTSIVLKNVCESNRLLQDKLACIEQTINMLNDQLNKNQHLVQKLTENED